MPISIEEEKKLRKAIWKNNPFTTQDGFTIERCFAENGVRYVVQTPSGTSFIVDGKLGNVLKAIGLERKENEPV